MNSKERLDNFINGKEVDRRPNLTIVGSVVTQYNNIGVDVYCKVIKKWLKLLLYVLKTPV